MFYTSISFNHKICDYVNISLPAFSPHKLGKYEYISTVSMKMFLAKFFFTYRAYFRDGHLSKVTNPIRIPWRTQSFLRLCAKTGVLIDFVRSSGHGR